MLMRAFPDTNQEPVLLTEENLRDIFNSGVSYVGFRDGKIIKLTNEEGALIRSQFPLSTSLGGDLATIGTLVANFEKNYNGCTIYIAKTNYSPNGSFSVYVDPHNRSIEDGINERLGSNIDSVNRLVISLVQSH